MNIDEILGSPELLHLADVVVPACSIAEGALSYCVQKRLRDIYIAYRHNEFDDLQSLANCVRDASWEKHPYFATYAETVIEAYWTCETGLNAVGFKRFQPDAS
jgi:hypothetical protein